MIIGELSVPDLKGFIKTTQITDGKNALGSLWNPLGILKLSY